MVDAPPWLWGGNPSGFFGAGKLRARRARDGASWVTTDESYRRAKRPLLVDAQTIIDAAGRRGGGFDVAQRLVDEEIEDGVAQSIRERGIAVPMIQGRELADFVYHAQTRLQSVSGSELATVCDEIVSQMREMTFSSGQHESVFPRASVLAVRRDPALVHRAKLTSVLVRVAHDEALARGELRQILADHAAGRSTFASSEGLLQGVYIFDVYLAPLEAALVPAVWAFAARRMHGTVLVSLGRPLAGFGAYPRELFGALRHPGETREQHGEYEQFRHPSAGERAVAWWAEKLDLMFGILTDPVSFARAGDRFDPVASMQARMSVEQLFQRVMSVQLAYRDTHARRVAFLSAMDTYRSLTGGSSLQDLFTHRRAERVLARVRDAIPVEAHDVLLPNAVEAVAALRQIQDGFFLVGRDGTLALDERKTSVSKEVAAAHYLAVLRDATHGFSTNDDRQRDKIAKLLVSHTGEVSHSIGLLAWLYLLDFLIDHDRLRRVLTSGHWVGRSREPRRK